MPVFINDLPSEMLSLIFMAILFTGTSPILPLVLRAVCRRWSAVAEETAGLWPGMVTGYGLAWTIRALKYSKSLPLDIVLPSGKGSVVDHQATELLVLSELRRIRSIVFNERPRISVMKALLHTPTPLLESLTMCGDGECPFDAQSNFCGSPLRLKAIALSRTHLSIDSPLLMSPLTTLHLTHCDLDEWSTDDIVVTLSRLPRLQSFVWLHPWPEAATHPTQPEQNGQRLQMPYLAHLKMGYHLPYILAVVMRIAPPLTCHVDLSAKLDEADAQNLLPTLNGALQAHLMGLFPAGSGFTYLDVNDRHDACPDDDHTLSARWYNPNAQCLEGASLDLTFHSTNDIDEALAQFFMHALRQWCGTASYITHLSLAHRALCEEAQTWRRIFDYLHNLSHLMVTGEANVTLFEALPVLPAGLELLVMDFGDGTSIILERGT